MGLAVGADGLGNVFVQVVDGVLFSLELRAVSVEEIAVAVGGLVWGSPLAPGVVDLHLVQVKCASLRKFHRRLAH
jgi:hypothetical protein